MAIYYLSLASTILFGVVAQIALKSGAVTSQTEGHERMVILLVESMVPEADNNFASPGVLVRHVSYQGTPGVNAVC